MSAIGGMLSLAKPMLSRRSQIPRRMARNMNWRNSFGLIQLAAHHERQHLSALCEAAKLI
jgi:hypothetical protein